MKVVVIGSGYVGLVSGVCLAEIGHDVICVEKDHKKVAQINSGEPPFYEVKLKDLLKKVIKVGRFSVCSDIANAMSNADISLIAVGTPYDGKEIDLSYIRQAAIEIGLNVNLAAPNHVVCVKSTVVPGTTRSIVKKLVEQNSSNRQGLGFGMNPEFLAEGCAVDDFMNPDRIVIGSDNQLTDKLLRRLYSPFDNVDIVTVSLETAEISKYTANSYFATLISFTNEIANLCSSIDDVDILDVMRIVHLDKRISPIVEGLRIYPGSVSFLHPGIGYGGSCFPKDVKSLITFAKENNRELSILKAVDNTNINQINVMVDLIKKKRGNLKGDRAGILGLAFKPGTDDIRESPAIKLIQRLLLDCAEIHAHDPLAIEATKNFFSPQSKINFHNSFDGLLKEVDFLILVTTWPEYKNIEELAELHGKAFFDGRRFLDKKLVPEYYGIGLNYEEN